MKSIRVVAAIICDDMEKPTRIFATAKGYGEFKEITVGERITTVEYDYPAFHLSMDCFWAQVKAGELVLNEAQEARWLTVDTLYDVEWLPADLGLIEKIKKAMSG